MTMPRLSSCEEYFDADRLNHEVDNLEIQCPVKGCTTQPRLQLPYRGRMLPYCEAHGLELHPSSRTFVYYNGDDTESKKQARLRNFRRCHWEFLRERVLPRSSGKAETHRLGHETSEDALTWNVFLPLLNAGRLGDTMRWLLQEHRTTITQEPRLYLWGSRVDVNADCFEPFEPLQEARKIFEPKKEVRRFPTEPDIMLITDNMVMCIEAKFTSGNSLAQRTETAEEGAKPKSRAGLIERYAKRWPESAQCLDHHTLELETVRLHSQLFRNIVFAAWMAEQPRPRRDWHVVNLVSKTQWDGKQEEAGGHHFRDPSQDVQRYLPKGYQEHFTFCTWEELYREVAQGHRGLEELTAYLRGKTAHLKRAFDI